MLESKNIKQNLNALDNATKNSIKSTMETVDYLEPIQRRTYGLEMVVDEVREVKLPKEILLWWTICSRYHFS